MFVVPGEEANPQPQLTGSIYIFTDDVDTIWQSAKDKTKVKTALADREYLMRDFSILDNNGYEIVFGKDISEQNPTPEEEILAAENTLLTAMKAGDIARLEELLHDQLLFIAPSGEIVTKEMDLAAHRSGAMIIGFIVPTVERVNIADDVATVVIVYETKGTMLGTPIEGKFRYIRIRNRQNGQWKVIAGSCTPA